MSEAAAEAVVTQPSASVSSPVESSPSESTPVENSGIQKVAPVEDNKEEPVKEESASERYARLIAKEKAQARRIAAQKEKDAQVQKELETYKQQAEHFKKVQELIKTNPKEALKLLNSSYDDLVNSELDAKETEELDPIRKELDERFEKLRMEQEEKELERLSKDNESKLAKFKASITDFTTNNAEKFPLLTEFHQEWGEAESPTEAIFSVIQENWKVNKSVITPEQAAKLIEDHFSTIAESYKKKLLKESPKAEVKVEESPKELPKLPETTLTNKLDPKQVAAPPEKPPTREELRERAKAVLERALDPKNQEQKRKEIEEIQRKKLEDFKRSRGLL